MSKGLLASVRPRPKYPAEDIVARGLEDTVQAIDWRAQLFEHLGCFQERMNQTSCTVTTLPNRPSDRFQKAGSFMWLAVNSAASCQQHAAMDIGDSEVAVFVQPNSKRLSSLDLQGWETFIPEADGIV